MSDNENFYESPRSDGGLSPLASPGRLTEAMVSYLKGASPWLRFIGVLAFIGAGITLLAGLICTVTGVLGAAFFDGAIDGKIEDTLDMADLGSALEGVTVLSGIFVMICGVLALIPARFIYNFGARIRNFLRNNSEAELELAFKNNKSLWKFTGIIAIIYLGLFPGMIIAIAIVVASSLF
jgi:hypothetical protein